jgi:putative endonuclease
MRFESRLATLWKRLARIWPWTFPWSRNRPLGFRGERLAAVYVKKRLRMKILARNVRCPHGELDLVALDGREIVFIEVRTLESEGYQRPENSIRRPKRQAVANSARWFYRTRRLKRFRPRIDVIAIVWPREGSPEIRHHRDAIGWSGECLWG